MFFDESFFENQKHTHKKRNCLKRKINISNFRGIIRVVQRNHNQKTLIFFDLSILKNIIQYFDDIELFYKLCSKTNKIIN